MGILHRVGIPAIVGGRTVMPALEPAIVQLGHCSGVLVRRDVVLTSAHCLAGPIDHVTIAGTATPVIKCERHPGYEPGRPAHDLGYCVLGGLPAEVTLAVDLDWTPIVGAPVTLAGFGQSSALAKEPPTLRMVDTTVVGIGDGFLASGSATATACRGDSGGPMLVNRDWHVLCRGHHRGRDGRHL